MELANQFARLNLESHLIAEGDIHPRIKEKVASNVRVLPGVFLGKKTARQSSIFYELDSLIVVNSDSKSFTTAPYWLGQSQHHQVAVDLKRIRQMNFLFNFIVSPSISLASIKPFVEDVRIITTNSKFFHEISQQSRYENVRHYPRMISESPIDPLSITTQKTPTNRIRIGMHSLPLENKWNVDFVKLIHEVNQDHKVQWHFMGMPQRLAEHAKKEKHVTVRKEFSMPVKEYLSNLDLFCFYSSFGREEPWSRAVAEALTSGCPVVSTHKGGNADQIVHGNNGFLCRSHDEFRKSIQFLLDRPEVLQVQRHNAIRTSRAFSSTRVAAKILDFIS